MAQIKIYRRRSQTTPPLSRLSDTIHGCVVEALNYPADKRFHRFIALEDEEFTFPNSRSPQYTILEISLFEGRSIEAKKRLIRLLFERFSSELGIASNDLEITIFETPKYNWGIRGLPGDELELNYQVEV